MGDSKRTVSVSQLDTLVRFAPKVSQSGFESPRKASHALLTLRNLAKLVCGGWEIRTPDQVAPMLPFQGSALDRYANPPSRFYVVHSPPTEAV